MKKFFKILFKTIGILLILSIVAVAMAYYALNLPSVQTKLVHEATRILTEKLGAKVQIGSVDILWFDSFRFNDVTIEDLEERKMIGADEVFVNSQGSFSFDPKVILNFSNELDYIMLKNPEFTLVNELDGTTNISNWLSKIDELTGSKPKSDKVPAAFIIREATIQNGTFSMIDPKEKPMPKDEFDYNNFTFSDINGNLEDVFLRGDTVKLRSKKLNGVDRRSGLTVNQIETDFIFHDQIIGFNNLFAKINNSVLKDKILLKFKKQSDLSDFVKKVNIDAHLVNSLLTTEDVALFAPALRKYKESVKINGDVNGTVSDLQLGNFKADLGHFTYVKGDFHFIGLPETEKMNMKIKLEDSHIEALDVKQIVDPKVYNDYIKKAEKIDLSGVFDGKIGDFTTDATIKTKGFGNIEGKISFVQATKNSSARYDGNFKSQNLNLGSILNQEPLLGKVTFSGKVDGQGFTVHDAKIKLKGKVEKLDFDGYTYQDINVDGILDDAVFIGEVDFNDPNLIANVAGSVDLSPEQNKFDIKGKLKKINLKPLGFSKDDYLVHTEFNIDMEGNQLDNIVGEAMFLNSFIKRADETTLLVDSLSINSKNADNKREFDLKSEFFDVDIDGQFQPSLLFSDLNQIVKEYRMFFTELPEERNAYYDNKKLNFQPNIYTVNYELDFKESSPFFDFFVPGLYVSKGGLIEGKLNLLSKNTQITGSGSIDTLKYQTNTFYKTDIDFSTSKLNTEAEVLSYLVLDGKEQHISNFKTENLALNASWGGNNKIDFDASVDQKASPNKAITFGEIVFLEDGIDLSLSSKKTKFTLLGENWKVPENNLILFKDGEICLQEFGVYNKNQSIKADGYISDNSDQYLEVAVTDFDLKTIDNFLDIGIKGIVNGKLDVKDLLKSPLIASNINIDELFLRDVLVGTIASNVDWDEKSKKLKVNAVIDRINSRIFSLVGTYDPNNEKSPLDLSAKLNRTELEIIQTFVSDIVDQLEGFATGDLTIKGTLSKPEIRGEVQVDRGHLVLGMLGTSVYFDDKILFTEQGFTTPSKGIELKDAPNSLNVATLKGGVYNGGDGNFMLGISLKIPDGVPFHVLNSKLEDNSAFYGDAFVSGNVSVTGPFDDIEVKGSLKSERGTKVGIPMDNTTVLDPESDGIPFLGKADNEGEEDSTEVNSSQLALSGVKIELNLNLTEDAEGTIILDRRLDDKMVVVGNGILSINYDTRGGFTMSGPYTVSKGTYNFSFQNMPSFKVFNIEKGSSLTWSGDPTDADARVKASYVASVPINELVGPGSNCANGNSARVPVSVFVNLTGPLLQPNLKFSIEVQQNEVPFACRTEVLGFEQRLKDDDQLMFRNVSSLIVLNKIFPENDLAASLNQQFLIDNASNLVSSKIGDVAKNFDPNLDLGVQLGDVTNQFNNARINVGYNFLDNRLKTSVNGTYNNSSIYSNNSSSSNQGQISLGGQLEYDLNQDGSWKIQLYSRSIPNSYYSFNATYGSIISYGVNLKFSKDFNRIGKARNNQLNPSATPPTPPVDDTPKNDTTKIISEATINRFRIISSTSN